MAEYSRMASGKVLSTGGQTAVIIPFIPNYIEISNATSLAGTNSGVSRAWWETDMGQGAAFLTTSTSATEDLTTFIDAYGGTNSTTGNTAGTGFSTIYAGLSLQYGPTVFLGATGGITQSPSAPVVTTSAAHGLIVGDVVIFQNLYQTATTGMQQMAGIPFQVVTVPSSTTFTINWNNSGSNYTAISAGGLNANASFKQVLYPALYAPGDAVISAIGLGTTTTVQTTMPTNVVVGQEVAFHIPTAWGTYQLNTLPNTVIPGSPIYGYVIAVKDSTNFTVNINSSMYSAYNSNQPFASFPGLKFPQLSPVGDVNTGGLPISPGSQLYPSPQVFNGYQGSTTVPVNTINGPAIQGAFINATFQGFIIGAAISGNLGDSIYWRAYLHDMNV